MRQVLTTLAQAMRCKLEDFSENFERLREILAEGGWSPAALTTHLVEFVAKGVVVFANSPADNLRLRLERLPARSIDCACRACRAWREANPPRRRTPRRPVASPARTNSFTQSALAWSPTPPAAGGGATAPPWAEKVPENKPAAAPTLSEPVRRGPYVQVAPNLLAEIERAAAQAVEERLREEREAREAQEAREARQSGAA